MHRSQSGQVQGFLALFACLRRSLTLSVRRLPLAAAPPHTLPPFLPQRDYETWAISLWGLGKSKGMCYIPCLRFWIAHRWATSLYVFPCAGAALENRVNIGLFCCLLRIHTLIWRFWKCRANTSSTLRWGVRLSKASASRQPSASLTWECLWWTLPNGVASTSLRVPKPGCASTASECALLCKQGTKPSRQ